MSARVKQAFKAILAFWILTASLPAGAQPFPSKLSHIIVPVAAGGLHDVLMRGVAQELSLIWGQPVIVENRLGATHVIATEYVVKSAPDGYTMLMTDRSFINNIVLRSKLPYDSFRDLAPVANMIVIPNAVFVRPDFPARTLMEFVDYARRNPGKVNYGSFGIASPPHIQVEGLSRMFGIRLTHVPYKGGIAEVIPALLGGQIQFGAGGIAAVVSFARQGKVRVFALSGTKRSPLLPDVPTYKEAGADQKSLSWTGFLVPVATPKPVIAKIAQDVKKVFSSREFISKFVEGVGLETNYLGPEDFAALLKEELRTYAEEVRSLNIKLD